MRPAAAPLIRAWVSLLAALAVVAAGLGTGVAVIWSIAADPEPTTYADRFEELERHREDAPVMVPVDPPPGYGLFNALPARTWVPSGFVSGRVPMVTLCPLDPGLDAAGTCYGPEQADHVAVLDRVVDGQRLVVVAQDGNGYAAADMIDDWRTVTYTSSWRSLDWITGSAASA